MRFDIKFDGKVLEAENIKLHISYKELCASLRFSVTGENLVLLRKSDVINFVFTNDKNNEYSVGYSIVSMDFNYSENGMQTNYVAIPSVVNDKLNVINGAKTGIYEPNSLLMDLIGTNISLSFLSSTPSYFQIPRGTIKSQLNNFFYQSNSKCLFTFDETGRFNCMNLELVKDGMPNLINVDTFAMNKATYSKDYYTYRHTYYEKMWFSKVEKEKYNSTRSSVNKNIVSLFTPNDPSNVAVDKYSGLDFMRRSMIYTYSAGVRYFDFSMFLGKELKISDNSYIFVTDIDVDGGSGISDLKGIAINR